VGLGRQRRVDQVDPRRQLDVEVARRVEAHPQAARAGIEDVAAAGAVGADEVKVVAGDLDPLGVGGEAEAEHRPLDVAQLEDVLLGDDLGQRPVGRLLARHGPGADELEATVEADRAGGGAGGDQIVQPLQQSFVVELLPGQPLVQRRFEPGDDRERGPLLGPHRRHVAVEVGAEEPAVKRDHLAVEVVERPQPEVAVRSQLAEAEIAVEGPVEQRPDRRSLEEDVRLALLVQVGQAHRLHVQRPDPALVQHRAQSHRTKGPVVTPSGEMAAIELSNAVKTFGPITAVDGLDLEVPEGICLGLLGPNGAGKSTTMRLLTGQAIADSGTLRVLGHELPGEAKTARGKMGVVPQLDNLDVDVTVEDNLAIFARLYRVPDVGAAVEKALAIARLQERRRDAVDQLSGGMRRRLLLARGLVHEPRLVLLDEPTVGLDPQIRTELWTLIGELKARGTTILMSTHYIEEAERLADEVAVMHQGKVISRGRPVELIDEHAGRFTAEIYGPPDRLAETRAEAESLGLAVRPAGPAIAIVGSEKADGFVPEDAVTRAASLEDVFVLLTGEEAK
jgi:lipooligosaccharide transport system ATP-binding protein